MEGALNKFLFSVSFFLVFQAFKAKKYVKFKLIPYQDQFHAPLDIKNSESSVASVELSGEPTQEIHQI